MILQLNLNLQDIDMNPIAIKKAGIADIATLQKIGTQTFIETFAGVNSPENIADYVAHSFNSTQLKAELNNPDSHFFIAILNQEAIGYLKINFGKAQTELLNENALEVQRIYVLKQYHGKKVGQLFMDEVIKIVQQKSVEYIWLGVWEENHKAIAFYAKNGFVVFDQHVFKLGEDIQTDLLMKREI